MQSHVKNVQLAAVAIVGLGIALFCSAYTIPEGCTGSITVSAAVYPDCGSLDVSATCMSDNDSDTITVNNSQLGSGVSVPFESEDSQTCDTTHWDATYPNPPVTIGLVAGLNKITATSGELSPLGITSSEYDITSTGANQPQVAIDWSWSSSLPCPPCTYPCGLLIKFNEECFKPKEQYWWGEDVVASGSCPSCANITGGGGPFTTDSSGNALTEDSAQVPCPSPIATTCTCSDVQTWHIDDIGVTPAQNNIVKGKTTRVKHTAPNVSTVTITSS